MKRIKNRDTFAPTNFQINAMIWCIRNGIKVVPCPEESGEVSIIVQSGDKRIVSPNTYKNHQLSKPVYEIYEFYYKKLYK